MPLRLSNAGLGRRAQEHGGGRRAFAIGHFAAHGRGRASRSHTTPPSSLLAVAVREGGLVIAWPSDEPPTI